MLISTHTCLARLTLVLIAVPLPLRRPECFVRLHPPLQVGHLSLRSHLRLQRLRPGLPSSFSPARLNRARALRREVLLRHQVRVQALRRRLLEAVPLPA
jgi:hypothetical protein